MNTNEPNNMSIKNLYFDIETGAAPDAEKFKPEFEAPGNIKDPVKIAAAIQDKENEWRDRLALSALTGQVLFCGFHDDERFWYGEVNAKTTEADLITAVFATLTAQMGDAVHGRVIGHNIKGFDLPFLIRRAWKLGVQVPLCLSLTNGRYWDSKIVDTVELWGAGKYQDYVSLDNLSKFLGVGAKNGKGGDFAALFKSDHDKAIEYAANDLELTRLCAKKMLS